MIFEACRPRLLAVAYGMLGDRGEAEDVVQDAWLRWRTADAGAVRNPEAFLVTVTTRLAIDRFRAARARREVYVGPWLPEPVGAHPAPAPADPLELAVDEERLSLALLAALERLNPVERAVLVLATSSTSNTPSWPTSSRRARRTAARSPGARGSASGVRCAATPSRRRRSSGSWRPSAPPCSRGTWTR